MKTVAILTPTYNRAHTLPRLYQSLREQTSFDFTWYVVDDGSTDETCQTVNQFHNADFDVVFIQKRNGGKHTALNKGLEHILEELTFIVDSDDYLLSNAVETVVKDWDIYKNRQNVCGLCYYKQYQDGTVVGDRYYFDSPMVDTYTNVRINKDVKGDKAEIYRTEILKLYPFPEIPGEKFLSEAVIWHAISRDSYELAFIGKSIYVCEYLEDGLTASGRKYRLQNPIGTMEHAKAFLYDSVKLKYRMKYMLLYTATRPFAKTSVREAYRNLPCFRLGYLICLLPGWILAQYWKHKYHL